MIKLWLLNKDEEIEKQLKLVSAVHTEEVNGANTLDFECYDSVEKNERVIYQDKNQKWHEFIIQEVKENKDTNEVYAEYSSYELRGDFITDKRPTGTPTNHLQELLSDTRWTIGTVEGFPSVKGTYYRLDAYKSINDMVALFNAYRTFEIKVVGNKVTQRLVNIKKTAGNDNGKRFVYSKDLEGIERTVLIGDVITALYGFGKGEEIGDGFGRRINFGSLAKPNSPIGKMYVADESARLQWGRNSDSGKKHVFASFEFDEIDDVNQLYEATNAKLQELNVPRVNYTANVTMLNESFENVGVGDTVAIIDNDFRGRELRLKGQVFKIVRDLIDATNSKIELGNYIDDVADTNKELIQYIKDFRDKTGVWDKANAFDSNGKLNGSYIADMLGAWNDLLNGAGGNVYATEGEGIITYDKPIEQNPTSAIQITGGGFRIANSKKPNGEWDWKTIGTGDGLAGEHIIANTITANKLASDVGASLDLSSNDSIGLIVSGINTKIDNIELTPGETGAPGTPGADGTDGADGKGISSAKITYQSHTSGKTTPTGAWLDTIPTVSSGNFLWTRTVITYTDNTSTTSYSVGKMGEQGTPGATGETGAPGTPGEKGETGVGVSTTEVKYAQSSSSTVKPTVWLNDIPNIITPGYFVWTRTIINYTNGNSTTAYSIGKAGEKGDKGTTGEKGTTGATGAPGIGIASTVITYGKNTSGTVAPTTWETTIPPVLPGQYLWTKTLINYTDLSSSTSYSVGKIGEQGEKGDKGTTGERGVPGSPGADGRPTYLWVAYADNANGGGISKSPTNKSHVGYASGRLTEAVEITTPSLYTWQLVKGTDGAKGDPGAKGTTGATGAPGVGVSSTTVTYKAHTSGTVAPTTWETTIPTVPSGQFLWTKTVILYTDGSSSTAYSIGKVGEQGGKGDTGAKGTTGATGAPGIGVASSKVDYKAHTSGTVAPSTWETNIPTVPSGQFLWTRTVISYTDLSSTTSYSVGKMGEQGIKGDTGGRGVPGVPGADGKPNWTWIKYADDNLGTGMTDDPTGKMYIGQAYNKDTDIESTDASLYVWNLSPNYYDQELDRIDGDIVTVTEELSASVVATQTSILDTVSAEYTKQSEFDIEKLTVQTQFEQTVEHFNFEFATLLQNFQDLDGATQEQFLEIVKYIRFIDGNIVLGQTGNEATLEIANTEIRFLQNGQKVAWFSNNELYVEDAQIVTSIGIGAFEFKPRSNGSLSFGKKV